ncbi:IS1/IS1595 family N-terminal zinc-binding domain-containing protein [Tychonema sp. LEGE 07196]|uniref:IS1/IS1595 family N-terminal zinc-binding domain-containing protein n=1 Tax=Tychonema sp. LEGE 07196 TaxID=1828665 RepID=UPI004040ABDC
MSEEVSRNGKTRHHKQNYKCRECGRQFVLNPEWKPITKEQQELMSRMLLERISQAGIARVLQVSKDTVQRYVNIAILNHFLCIGVLIDFGEIKFMFLCEKLKQKFNYLKRLT